MTESESSIRNGLGVAQGLGVSFNRAIGAGGACKALKAGVIQW